MGLYSSWPLVGGALSKAIGESFSGLTAGGLEGEEVRHKRASENIQQQYLQHALQQLAQQRAFQEGSLGWRGLQLAEQVQRDRAAEAQRAETAGDTRNWRQMQEQRWGEDRALREDWQRKQDVRWQEDREQRTADKAAGLAETSRKNRETAAVRWADIGIRAQKAAAATQKLLAGSTALNQQQKLQLSQLNMRARDIRQQIALASHAEDMGRAPQVPMAKLMTDLAAVEDAIQEMANVAGGAAPSAGPAPKALDAAGVRQKWFP